MICLNNTKYITTLLTFIIIIFLFTGKVMAYEEPKYVLIKKTDVYEVRSYEDRLAVKTFQEKGQDRAFGRLFKYISGSNQSSSKIAMTIPVLQSKESNGSAMYFFLPKSYSQKNAPLPKSDNIKLVTVKRGYYAVIKYTGRTTDQNFKQNTNLLKESLKNDDISFNAEPIQAIYNGPFTPFFLRRNEAMYRINWK